jgi:enamine deaminase RidA (YjgF/YER057c/UK114 family)
MALRTLAMRTAYGGLNGYSPALSVAVTSGQLIFVSGQIARTPHGQVIASGDAAGQADVCFTQIEDLLREAGGSLRDVTRLVYYLTDIDRDLAAVCRMRDERTWGVPPASTAIEVARLASEGLVVEIEATAVVNRPTRSLQTAARIAI